MSADAIGWDLTAGFAALFVAAVAIVGCHWWRSR
jgi:hypothetical protein